jgi:hypothetical protein
MGIEAASNLTAITPKTLNFSALVMTPYNFSKTAAKKMRQTTGF